MIITLIIVMNKNHGSPVYYSPRAQFENQCSGFLSPEPGVLPLLHASVFSLIQDIYFMLDRNFSHFISLIKCVRARKT